MFCQVLHGVVFEILIEDNLRMKIVGLMMIGHVTPKKICFSQAWNPKQPFFNGFLVISNHFPSKTFGIIQLSNEKNLG